MALVHKLSPHVSFSKNWICEIEQEFILLQWFDLSAFDDYVKDKATTRTSGDRKSISYRIYTFWN